MFYRVFYSVFIFQILNQHPVTSIRALTPQLDLSQFFGLKFRLSMILIHIKFPDPQIPRLWNCKRFGRVASFLLLPKPSSSQIAIYILCDPTRSTHAQFQSLDDVGRFWTAWNSSINEFWSSVTLWISCPTFPFTIWDREALKMWKGMTSGRFPFVTFIYVAKTNLKQLRQQQELLIFKLQSYGSVGPSFFLSTFYPTSPFIILRPQNPWIARPNVSHFCDLNNSSIEAWGSQTTSIEALESQTQDNTKTIVFRLKPNLNCFSIKQACTKMWNIWSGEELWATDFQAPKRLICGFLYRDEFSLEYGSVIV